MCGIVGWLNLDHSLINISLLRKMTNVLSHRGPDDEGFVLIDTSTGRFERRATDFNEIELHQSLKYDKPTKEFSSNLAFGHRRLSIIDLTPTGRQPMCNEDGTIWIVYNGEIYNFIELREELSNKGHVFYSKTDTEVIIHAYEEWGTHCFSKFNGMWAFVIWDANKKTLICSRDRFGIKPFYYYFDGRCFLFASEAKALLEASIKRSPNLQIIHDYLKYGLLDHSEDTFFLGIKHLQASHYMELQIDQQKLNITRYYEITYKKQSSILSDDEYSDLVFKLFEDSVRLRLRSDVPVGSCLSGGLDSSSIVCMVDSLLRKQGIQSVKGEKIQKTFSACNDDPKYDESFFMKEITKKTGAEANYIFPTAKGLQNDLKTLIWYQEEPFGSISSYAQWKVHQLIHQSKVKVVLDGQGSDEIFAGYDSYIACLFSDLIKNLQWLEFVREFKGARQQSNQVPIQALKVGGYHLIPESIRASVHTLRSFYSQPWMNKEFFSGFNRKPFFPNIQSKDLCTSMLDKALIQGIFFVGLPHYLRSEDKNSMAHSVEARVPFLDYRLVELAFSLPAKQKIHNGTRKFALRNAMKSMLPESVRNRKDKMVFGLPENLWFRTSLRETIYNTINSESFRNRPFFNIDGILKEFDLFEKGKKNTSSIVWRWINLEHWMRVFID